jgi:hypothetical protein
LASFSFTEAFFPFFAVFLVLPLFLIVKKKGEKKWKNGERPIIFCSEVIIGTFIAVRILAR